MREPVSGSVDWVRVPEDRLLTTNLRELSPERRLVCTVHSTKSCLTRHRYRRITPLSRSIRVLVRGPLFLTFERCIVRIAIRERMELENRERDIDTVDKLCRGQKTPATVPHRFVSLLRRSHKIRMIN